MKNFRWFMIVIVSICFIIGIVSLGWSAEIIKQIKPGVITPVSPAVTQALPHCPPGFDATDAGFASGFYVKCNRSKPANPCAQGYHVVWGPCPPQYQSTGGGLNLPQQDPECSYKCIPDVVKFQLQCPKGYHSSALDGTFSCSAFCDRDLY